MANESKVLHIKLENSRTVGTELRIKRQDYAQHQIPFTIEVNRHKRAIDNKWIYSGIISFAYMVKKETKNTSSDSSDNKEKQNTVSTINPDYQLYIWRDWNTYTFTGGGEDHITRPIQPKKHDGKRQFGVMERNRRQIQTKYTCWRRSWELSIYYG